MNEEMRRNMDFIVKQQARFSAHLEQLEEERVRDRPRLAEVEKSFQRLVALLEIQESRLDRSEARLDKVEFNTRALESSMTALANAEARTDERLRALIEAVMQDRNNRS